MRRETDASVLMAPTDVAKLLAAFKHLDVSDMQEVEASVGEHDGAAKCSVPGKSADQFIAGEDLLGC